MTAVLINTINDCRVVVHATTEHPASSYGIPVWVDDNNEAYIQVGAKSPFYEIIPIDTLDQFADYINDYMDANGNDWPTDIHEIIEANGWEDLSDNNYWGIARDNDKRLVLADNGRAEVWEG